MANYAHIMTAVSLNKSIDNPSGDELMGEFSKIFGDVEFYNENCDTESFYGFNADFDWKWSAPLDELKGFCKKYNVTITGTGSDLDNSYAEGFDLPNKIERCPIHQEIEIFKTDIETYNYPENKTDKNQTNLEFIESFDCDDELFNIGYKQGLLKGLNLAHYKSEQSKDRTEIIDEIISLASDEFETLNDCLNLAKMSDDKLIKCLTNIRNYEK